MITRAAIAIVLLAFASSSNAMIHGPTTSTGEFTLSWAASGWDPYYEFLIDDSTNQQYSPSPATFSKPDGSYTFTHYGCILVTTVSCFELDTHTVVVSGSTTPPSAPEHVVTYGDLNNDGLIDIAVIATDPAARLVEDFVLLNSGGGEFQVLTAPTSAQITVVRNWPISIAAVQIADFSSNGKFDVVINGLSSLVPGAAHNLVAWSELSSASNFPTSARSMRDEQTTFLSELADALSAVNYFANAITQFCFTQAGWYQVPVFVSEPGWYLSIYGTWVYVSQPGYYTFVFYFQVGTCIDVLDPAIVQSAAAFDFESRWSILEGASSGTLNPSVVAEIYAIVRSILGADIGDAGSQPPYNNETEAERSVIQVIELLSDLGRAFSSTTSDMALTYGQMKICDLRLAVGSIPLSPSPYRMPAVSHGPAQSFLITQGQQQLASGSTDSQRRAFWQDRWDVSRDPLGPLGVSVVDDAYLLGCLANSRLLTFAAKASVSVDLTTVGFDVIEGHVDVTEIVQSKLSAQQIAQYHHTVFAAYGLPPTTFGGTPFGDGDVAQANRTKIIWCRSCD